MPAGTTYTPIATTTTSGNATSYTFSSIPSTYTDLVIVGNGSVSSACDMYIQFNGDTGTNYNKMLFYGTGSAAGGAAYTNVAQIGFSYQDGSQSNSYANIMNYTNTNVYKPVLSKGGSASSALQVNAGLWRSTSAINSIKVYPSTGNFVNGYTLTLYGIAAA